MHLFIEFHFTFLCLIKKKNVFLAYSIYYNGIFNYFQITSVEVLEACIRRIKDVNSALNCFIEDRFELAFKEAREADDLIRGGSQSPEQLEKEKPFLGVPFTTKDCMAVKGEQAVSFIDKGQRPTSNFDV